VKQYQAKISWKKIKQHWQFYLILLLPILYVLVFHYVPMWGIIIAFKRYTPSSGIAKSPWVGLLYFEQFFKSPSSLKIIWNTLILSIYSIIAGFPIPIMLAIALNEVRMVRFKKIVQMVTYAPYFISTVVMVGLMFQLTDPRIGIVNQIIQLLGGKPVNFMGEPGLFRHMYVWSGIWQSAGYSSVIYLAALSGINVELQEAAIIDGASRVKRIWYVDLPCIKSTIMVLLILNLGYAMNVGFEKVYLMQNSLNVSRAEIISTYVYKVGLVTANFSFATAIGLFNSIVNLVLLIISNYVVKRLFDTSLW